MLSVGTDYYSGLMESYTSAGTADKVSGTLSGISEESTDEELMEACRSFESYFVEQVFKGMEKTIMKDDKQEEGDYLSNFKDILYKEYAQGAVDNGEFGIARLLYDSMRRV